MTASPLTIALAAGGTGGHLFPACALAEELRARGVRLVLVVDKRAMEFAKGMGQTEVHAIRAGRLSGNVLRKLAGVVDIGVGFLQARRLLKKTQARAVVGFGGYPSFPTMLAAEALRLPMIVHEQNAVLGRANRVLAARVDRVATSFSDIRGVAEQDLSRVVMTGNPVRSSILALHDAPYPEFKEDEVLTLLVIGGSLGTSLFSDVVPHALSRLPENLCKRIRVEQQCREDDLKMVRMVYDELGMEADLATFFNDMPERLARAHLVIARAGASTVAELVAAARPAIFVPWPGAMDDHQTVNANAAEERGCGWVMPESAFTPEALSARIEAFLNLPASLNQAAERAREERVVNAAANLADLVMEMVEGQHNSGEKRMIL